MDFAKKMDLMSRLINSAWCIACIGLLCTTGCGPKGKNASAAERTGFALDLSAEEFSRYTTDSTSILLDVRTQEEFQSGHISGALMIDYYDEDFAHHISTLDKEKTIYIYCRSGGRSGRSMKMMREQGFDRLYNLHGGIMEWMAEGRTVKYPDGP
jgi:rhodanese-related sulfurtransferase